MKSESRSGAYFKSQFRSTQWYCTSETEKWKRMLIAAGCI